MNNAIPLLFPGLCFQSILTCEVKLLSHLAAGVGSDAVSGMCSYPNLTQMEDIRLFLRFPTERFLSYPSPSTFFRSTSLFFLSNNFIFFALLFSSFSPPPSVDLSWPRWLLCAGAPERWEIGKWRRASDQSSLPLCFVVSLQRQHPYPDWKVISPFYALQCLPLTPRVVCFVLASYHTGRHQPHIKPDRLSLVSALSLVFLLFAQKAKLILITACFKTIHIWLDGFFWHL